VKNRNITSHARKRMNQRAINDVVVQLIETFGEFKYQKGGEHYAYVNEKTIAKLRKAVDKLSSARAIYGESDKLVTAFHQTRRVRATEYSA